MDLGVLHSFQTFAFQPKQIFARGRDVQPRTALYLDPLHGDPLGKSCCSSHSGGGPPNPGVFCVFTSPPPLSSPARADLDSSVRTSLVICKVSELCRMETF